MSWNISQLTGLGQTSIAEPYYTTAEPITRESCVRSAGVIPKSGGWCCYPVPKGQKAPCIELKEDEGGAPFPGFGPGPSPSPFPGFGPGPTPSPRRPPSTTTSGISIRTIGAVGLAAVAMIILLRK